MKLKMMGFWKAYFPAFCVDKLLLIVLTVEKIDDCLDIYKGQERKEWR